MKGRFTSLHQQKGKGKLTRNFAEFKKEKEKTHLKNRSADVSTGCHQHSSAVLGDSLRVILFPESYADCSCTDNNLPPKLFLAGYTAYGLNLLALGLES